MKKLIVLLALIMFVSGALVVCSDVGLAAWWDKDKATEEANAEEVQAVAAPTAGAGTTAAEAKLVCSFKTDEKMAEFEQLYVAKQATFGRMGVLQAYFAMEQNNLTTIDQQMNEKFGFTMDPSKMYDLNRETKEIREVGPVVPPAPPAN